jgi:two-component sensor histidine kinase
MKPICKKKYIKFVKLDLPPIERFCTATQVWQYNTYTYIETSVHSKARVGDCSIGKACSMLAVRWTTLILVLYLLPNISFAQNFQKIDSLKTALRQTLDASMQFNAAYNLAESYRNHQTDSAKHYLDKAFEAVKQARSPHMEAQAWLLKGMLWRDETAFDKCIEATQHALNLYESLGDQRGIGKSFSAMGMAYKKMGDVQKVVALTQKALEYAEKSVKILEPVNDTFGLIAAYSTLGIIYRDLKIWDKTEQAYKNGMAIAQRYQVEGIAVATINGNFGQLLMDYYKDYPAAIVQFNKALQMHEKLENKPGIESSYRNLCIGYSRMKSHEKAVAYGKLSVEKALEINDGHRMFNAYQILGKAQEGAGLYEDALESFINFKWYEDSIMRVEKTRAIAEMENKYESAKKETEIARLSDKNLAQRQLLTVGGSALVVLLGLLTVFFFQNRKIRQNQRQIAEQANQLQLMMRELHHRVKNNLAIVSSLLKIQSNKIEDEKAVQAVRQGQQRVEAMSLIHQRLYQTDKISEINIREYITDLVESLMRAYGNHPDNFDLHVNIEQERLDVDTAMPLGLIINEVLTNSFKYAYDGNKRPALIISLTMNADLHLEIRDNGKGIDLVQWQQSKDSFGKKLITGLSRQLGGEFSVSNQNGALFSLHIPAEKLKKAA